MKRPWGRSVAVWCCISRCRYSNTARPLRDIPFDRQLTCCGVSAVLLQERAPFETGPMLALNRSEMKTTRQLNGLARNLGHESMNRPAWSSETQRRPVDDLAVSCAASFVKISEQEESL